MAQRRIQRELRDWQKDPPTHCAGGPIDENDLFRWEVTLNGPSDSPYEEGVFKLAV